MEVRLLGPLQLVRDGIATPVGRAGERALLALLATAPQRTITRDSLIDALWGEALPANPDNALQLRVSRLRSIVGPALVTDASGYRLHVGRDAVDVTRFERCIAERRFEDALALWRGKPLAEFAQYEWARSESRRLQELHATAIEQRVDARLAAGKHVFLVAEVEGLVAAAPLREQLRGLLMAALYRAGRAADALAEFRAFRTMLHEELGVEPSAALRRLEADIFRQDPSPDPPSKSTRNAGVGRNAGTTIGFRPSCEGATTRPIWANPTIARTAAVDTARSSRSRTPPLRPPASACVCSRLLRRRRRCLPVDGRRWRVLPARWCATHPADGSCRRHVRRLSAPRHLRTGAG